MTAALTELPLTDSYPSSRSSGNWSRFFNLRGVRWRIDLGVLPSSPSASVDHLRRFAADARRRYVSHRRRLVIDPHIPKDGNKSPDLSVENPLSQNPDSAWGRFFRNAELEKTVNQDLSRLYAEYDHYFQTPACQAMLRRVLLVWCLKHPECGYRQGMHELLAPLIYVLHADLDYLSQVRGHYDDFFSDEFDGAECEVASISTLKKGKSLDIGTNADDFDQKDVPNITSFHDLDPETRDVLLLSDSYGAEGELGVVLSEKFMEHDAYCMFDGLMSGAHGVVAMVDFFSNRSFMGSSRGLPPIIEASLAIYHLLSFVDSSLHGHLVQLKVEPQYFALRWLRVLFGREFSLSDLLIIWDELFASFNGSCVENNDFRFKIMCSKRGSFILAMAVSMLVHVRSSLLATENATSCLKRLLNFPKNVSVEKLIEKAKYCQILAMDANISGVPHLELEKNNSPAASRYCSTFSKLPIRIMPDSYWEEKWRVLHKGKSLQDHDSSNSGGTKGLLCETLESSRVESYPYTEKKTNNVAEAHSPTQCNMFDDLPLNAESPLDEDVQKFFSEDPGYESSIRTSESICEESLSTGNSSVLSLNGPNDEANDPEIKSEKSSVTSSLFVRENDDEIGHLEEEYSIFVCNSVLKESLTIADAAKSEPIVALQAIGASEKKVKKSASGKFHWFWRVGKGNLNEKSMEKGTLVETQRSSHISKESAGQVEQSTNYAINYCRCGDTVSVKEGDLKMMGTFKNLGQSTLDNVQVIESILQQEQLLAGNILSGKDQAAAMAALNELRKISITLSGM